MYFAAYFLRSPWANEIIPFSARDFLALIKVCLETLIIPVSVLLATEISDSFQRRLLAMFRMAKYNAVSVVVNCFTWFWLQKLLIRSRYFTCSDSFQKRSPLAGGR